MIGVQFTMQYCMQAVLELGANANPVISNGNQRTGIAHSLRRHPDMVLVFSNSS